MGFSDRQTDLLTIVGIVTALLGAVIAGRLTDLLGPRRTLHGALYLWMIAIVLAVAVGVTGLTDLGWLIGAVGGAALGATSATDRVYMTRISPPAPSFTSWPFNGRPTCPARRLRGADSETIGAVSVKP